MANSKQQQGLTLQLASRTEITPTIARYVFRVAGADEQRHSSGGGINRAPGQWVALDFSVELDQGYSHMRDEDPSSLNDDWVRTFTVSRPPLYFSNDQEGNNKEEDEVEVTLRTHGPVTRLLRRWRLGGTAVPLTVGLLGIGGGEMALPTSDSDPKAAFFAAGVGITPLLGHATTSSQLQVLWVIRAEDAAFVQDTLQRRQELRGRLVVWFTGSGGIDNIDLEKLDGVKTIIGRPTKEQILKEGNGAEKWFLCASKAPRTQMMEWLKGKEIIFENFDY
jgi:ferredoxin-NADP reductase